MARKKAASKAEAQLPKGFTAIGGFGKTFPGDDTKAGEAIQGVVLEYQENIKTQHGVTALMRVETATGEIYTVWQSAGLAVLFDEDYTDCEVWIRFDGLGKKKGKKNPPKLFTLAVNE